ncbi:MAG: hypothetical protein KF798_06055 [Candidatus Paracaedibacteraceae bacterium]|nr:hypothetical protein [Candidatus Paracaedibacteraceae bacterium]
MLSGPSIPPENGGQTRQLVVILHGYGADGENLIDLGQSWSEMLPDAEFIAPNGIEPCEMGIGYQWFGLRDYAPFNIRAGLDRATPLVAKWIKAELQTRSLPLEALSLVGFSQGTMLSLDLMFHLQGIKNILGYSGAFYPPVAKTLSDPRPNVMLVHGDMDMVVPYLAFNEALKNLCHYNLNPESLTCSGLGHGIDMQGLQAGGHFLKNGYASADSVIIA